jgi:(E)-4-hydroxy-3-methyl-but-2-enyl pyrophosphate reductase
MAMGSAAHAEQIDGFTDIRKDRFYPAGNVTITVARHSGYCWGVQRAYDMVVAEANTAKAEAAAGKPGAKVTTFGPLIHNPQTISDLRDRYGVDYVTDPAHVNEGKVIIRTHGAPLEMQEKLAAKGLDVIDATCPYVRVTQRYAALLHKEKYHVVIIGDPNHPEVISILSYAGGEGTVVKTPDEVANIPHTLRRLGVVVQSTMILEKVNMIVARLVAHANEVRIFNTICYVTDERQDDAEEIAKENEFVVVIGGKESSNTRKLAVVAERFGARTQLIEGPEDLRPTEFGAAKKIGVLAGASTPNWLIDDVVGKIQRHYGVESAAVPSECGCSGS